MRVKHISENNQRPICECGGQQSKWLVTSNKSQQETLSQLGHGGRGGRGSSSVPRVDGDEDDTGGGGDSDSPSNSGMCSCVHLDFTL